MRILLISQAGLGSCHVLAIWVSETESHSLAQSDLGLTVKSAGQSSGLSHKLRHLRKSVDTGCRGILGLSYFFCVYCQAEAYCQSVHVRQTDCHWPTPSGSSMLHVHTHRKLVFITWNPLFLHIGGHMWPMASKCFTIDISQLKAIFVRQGLKYFRLALKSLCCWRWPYF